MELQQEIHNLSATFSTVINTLAQMMQITSMVPPSMTPMITPAPTKCYDNASCTPDHRQPADLIVHQQEIQPTTITLPYPLLHPHLPSMTMKMTMTSVATNATDDHRHGTNQQPIDLLTLQWVIKETMISMDLFFGSLPQPPAGTTSKHDLPNNSPILTTQTINPTLHTAKHPLHKTHPISTYLTMLHTPAYFVPHRILHGSALGTQSTSYLLIRKSAPTRITHRHYQHQLKTPVPACAF